MGIVSKISKPIFKLMPYKNLSKLYAKAKKSIFTDAIDENYREKFFKKSKLFLDFDKYIEKAKGFTRFCLIQQGTWDYRVINFCFIREMISNIIWCLENGYKPVIDIDAKIGNYSERTNLWEKMFKQPFETNLKDIKSKGNYIVCPIKTYVVCPHADDARDSQISSFWNKMYREFFVFNDYCQEYVDNEFNTILKDKKTLGCLGRGTDYLDLKPKGHPIQPSIEELIQKSKQIMEEQNLEYIYLATEEKKIADNFKKSFPGKILENKRYYYDEDYDKNDKISRVSQVSFNRENDDFLKALEYISSITLLSKCNSMVAGLCGGSEAAVYLNGGKYDICYIFDKGIY